MASTWSDSFDILLDAYEQIGNEIPLLEQYKSVFENDPHMVKVLGFIYKDILDFHKRAIRFFQGRGRSSWPLYCQGLTSNYPSMKFGVKFFVRYGVILKLDSTVF